MIRRLVGVFRCTNVLLSPKSKIPYATRILRGKTAVSRETLRTTPALSLPTNAKGPDSAMDLEFNCNALLEPAEVVKGIFTFMATLNSSLKFDDHGELVDRAKCVLIRGPPQVGKSFTAKRIHFYWNCVQQPASAKQVPDDIRRFLSSFERIYYFSHNFEEKTTVNDAATTLLILDEAHGFFSAELFQNILKSGLSTLIMFSTTSADLEGVTPVCLQKNNSGCFLQRRTHRSSVHTYLHTFPNVYPRSYEKVLRSGFFHFAAITLGCSRRTLTL